MTCAWCDRDPPEAELFRCFHCKTLVCEACGVRHFGPNQGHEHLALQAKFWRDAALRHQVRTHTPDLLDACKTVYKMLDDEPLDLAIMGEVLYQAIKHAEAAGREAALQELTDFDQEHGCARCGWEGPMPNCMDDACPGRQSGEPL